MEPSFPTVSRAGYRRTMALRMFGFFAGAVIGVALIIAGVTWYRYGTIEGLFAGLTLPEELTAAYFLYQHDGVNTVYYFENGRYVPLNLGTTLQTVALSRRDSHVASIQRSSDGMYEVRADAALRYRSTTTKFSPAISPDGRRVAFAEASIDVLQNAQEEHRAAFETQVVVVDEQGESMAMGNGFSPFFIENDVLAWFTREGMLVQRVPVGTTTVLAGDIRPLPPPYPGPAVSRDGHLIAWAEPTGQVVHIGRVTDTGIDRVTRYTNMRSPIVALGAGRLYSIVQSTEGAGIFAHKFLDDEKGTRVYGFPNRGTLVQIAP